MRGRNTICQIVSYRQEIAHLIFDICLRVWILQLVLNLSDLTIQLCDVSFQLLQRRPDRENKEKTGRLVIINSVLGPIEIKTGKSYMLIDYLDASSRMERSSGSVSSSGLVSSA